jgi:hypothetical protein
MITDIYIGVMFVFRRDAYAPTRKDRCVDTTREKWLRGASGKCDPSERTEGRVPFQ